MFYYSITWSSARGRSFQEALFTFPLQIQPVTHTRIVVSARWRKVTDGTCTIKSVLIQKWLQNHSRIESVCVIQVFFFFCLMNCSTVSLPTESCWFLQFGSGSQSTLLKAGKVFYPWWHRKWISALGLFSSKINHLYNYDFKWLLGKARHTCFYLVIFTGSCWCIFSL